MVHQKSQVRALIREIVHFLFLPLVVFVYMYILKMNSSHNIHDCTAFTAKYTSIITSNCKIMDFEHCFGGKLSRKEGYGHTFHRICVKQVVSVTVFPIRIQV